MAMVHPDDQLAFAATQPVSHDAISVLFISKLGLAPVSISTPATQGEYNYVSFVKLEEGEGPWSGKDVVLRVARPNFPHIKVRNEVSVISLVRTTGVPAPRVIFWSDTNANPLGFEYLVQERILHRSIQEHWPTMGPAARERVLDQIVSISASLFTIRLVDGPKYGSIQYDEQKNHWISGPVLEETMWQIPDILRYFHSPPFSLSPETSSTLNPVGPFPNWPSYISAFLKSYVHIAGIHPSVAHLRLLLPALSRLIAALDAETDVLPWVVRLRNEEGLIPHLWHCDLHLGNLLGDEDGTVHGVIDWEFAAFGATFPRAAHPIPALLWSVPNDPTLETWPTLFLSKFATAYPSLSESYQRGLDKDVTLGEEGKALSAVREFMRSCLEVGVRGWGNVKSGKGAWVDTVKASLASLEFPVETA